MKELIGLAMEIATEEILPRWPHILAWNLYIVALVYIGRQDGFKDGWHRAHCSLESYR